MNIFTDFFTLIGREPKPKPHKLTPDATAVLSDGKHLVELPVFDITNDDRLIVIQTPDEMIYTAKSVGNNLVVIRFSRPTETDTDPQPAAR